MNIKNKIQKQNYVSGNLSSIGMSIGIKLLQRQGLVDSHDLTTLVT